MHGTMTSSNAKEEYPWVVTRHGDFETELRELMKIERPEIDLDMIFNSVEDLLSHMPNANNYNEMFDTSNALKEIIDKGYNLQMVGLLYGRVQSGKTIASICFSALAADNGYRNVIVLTSNVELLHIQTMVDFKETLPWAAVLGEPKSSTMVDYEHKITNLSDDKMMIITGKKNSKSLEMIERAFTSTKRGILPTLIIDDEGDQASLNIGTKKKTSEIYQSISNIRSSIGLHCFVTVTATPFANLQLDSEKEKELYPEIIQSLPPGKGYTGADVFFNTHKNDVWREVSLDEKELLKIYTNDADFEEIPVGFKKAVIYHLLSCRVRKFAKLNGEHSMLINVERDKKSHNNLKKTLERILNHLAESCKINSSKWESIKNIVEETMSDICNNFDAITHDSIDVQRELYESLSANNLSIQIINADNPVPPNYGGDYRSTFLIGQTKLGRGLRIRGLVTTYFLYAPKIANMDSYSQACRFFGYRKRILPLMRIFSPIETIRRWQHIRVMEKYTYDYLDGLSSKSYRGLISLDRPLMLLQSKLNSSRKVVGSKENEIQSPIDDVFWHMSIIPRSKNTHFSIIVGDLLDSSPLDINLASEIVQLFDNTSTNDHSWPSKFLVNILENIHSQEPYVAKSLKIFSSDRAIRLEENEDLPILSIDESEQIVEVSHHDSVVLYLRKITQESIDFYVPCLYLPPLQYGFHVK